MQFITDNATTVINAGAVIFASCIAGGAAVLGSFLTNRSNQKRLSSELAHKTENEKMKISVEKGEELHQLISAWRSLVQLYMDVEKEFIKGQIYWNDVEHTYMEHPLRLKQERISTLILIYFPELTENFRKIKGSFDLAHGLVIEIRNSSLDRDETMRKFLSYEKHCIEYFVQVQITLQENIKSQL